MPALAAFFKSRDLEGVKFKFWSPRVDGEGGVNIFLYVVVEHPSITMCKGHRRNHGPV